MGEERVITRDQAMEIALAAVRLMRSSPQKGAPVTVEFKDDLYIVTFWQINPPGMRRSDFLARVFIRRKTGRVEQYMIGVG